MIADTSLLGGRYAREAATLFNVYGKTVTVVSDNGTEFTPNAVLAFAVQRQVTLRNLQTSVPAPVAQTT